MPRPSRPLLTVLLLAALPLPARAQPAAPAAPPADFAAEDKQTLETAKLGTDGPALLDFFRKRTPADKDLQRADGLIRQLSEDAFPVRQKAAEGLVALGLPALPPLRRALGHPDEEVRQRAAECLQVIDPSPRGALAGAAARRLRVVRPAGAVPVLLAYLPAADDDATDDEVLTTLVVLGVRDGQVDPGLAAALRDKAPERRAAAGLVLGRSGTAEQRAAVRGLLTDADPRVRFRAAQGLLAGRERDGIPVLVALLADGPLELAEPSLDLLSCVAGTDRLVPTTPLGSNERSRTFCRDAWAAWWKRSGHAASLAAREVDVPLFNPTLQARTAVRQFFAAFRRGDLVLFQKVTDVPFVTGVDQTITVREQLDRLCLSYPPPGNPVLYTVGGMVSVDAYLKGLPTEQRAAFQALRKPEYRVVTVSGSFPGKVGRSVVMVRVTGGRAQVVGIGQEMLGGQPFGR
jgi:HEAT repeat protein